MKLDITTDEWTKLLAKAPIYIKKVTVRVCQVTERTEVYTRLADGTVETVNIAEPGDKIITNPDGEQYVLKPDNFAKRYEATEEKDIFRAKGWVRAVQNPTGGAIEIIAPWGQIQYGGSDCMIATVYDPEQPDAISNDRFIIGYEEFRSTYVPAE